VAFCRQVYRKKFVIHVDRITRDKVNGESTGGVMMMMVMPPPSALDGSVAFSPPSVRDGLATSRGLIGTSFSSSQARRCMWASTPRRCDQMITSLPPPHAQGLSQRVSSEFGTGGDHEAEDEQVAQGDPGAQGPQVRRRQGQGKLMMIIMMLIMVIIVVMTMMMTMLMMMMTDSLDDVTGRLGVQGKFTEADVNLANVD
jgi:hypothetical protein